MTRLFDLLKTPYPEVFKSLHAAGIQAASAKNWATLQNTVVRVEKSEFATFKVRERIEQLKPKTGDHLSDAASQRERLHWARLLQPGYLKWQQHHIAQLNDPRWWQQCFETVKSFSSEKQHAAETTLRALQARWSVQQAYVHYSTIDLIHVYQSVMPVFARWLGDVQREWLQHAHRFTPSQQMAYQTYLSEFENALAEEKKRLRACLQGRLEVGLQKGNGTRDNVIDALHDEFKAMGLLAPDPRREKALAYGHLTPQAFVAIEAIFQQDGSESEKQAFFALPYYCPPVDNAENFDKDTGKMLPLGNRTHLPSRSDVMPSQPFFYRKLPRFLRWLFWDEYVDEQFFRRAEHRSLQRNENAFLVLHSYPPLSQLDYDAAWQTGQSALRDLITERERASYWLAHPLAFFFPATVKRLVDYIESLTQRADAWVARQLRIVMDGMAAKADQPFNAVEKAALEKAACELQVAKKQWRLSSNTFRALNQFEMGYGSINFLPADASQILPAESAPALPLRDQFRESIRQAVVRFEAVQMAPMPCLDALKTQLAVEPSLYDSAGLRLWLENHLAQTTLPDDLSNNLRAILNQPEFSYIALNCDENRALKVESRERIAKIEGLRMDQRFTLLNESPWNESREAMKRCGQRLKEAAIPRTDPQSIPWNDAFCQHTVRFLMEMQKIACWEDFVVRREAMTQWLAVLIEISATQFPGLHRHLNRLVTAQVHLTVDQWDLFMKHQLSLSVNTLVAFLKVDNPAAVVTSPLPHNILTTRDSRSCVFFKLPPKLCVTTQPLAQATYPKTQ